MTIRSGIIAYVRYHPGKTAWEIANAIQHSSSSVSSALTLMARRKQIKRRRPKNAQRGWEYFIQ